MKDPGREHAERHACCGGKQGYVMRMGEVILSGPSEDVASNQDMQDTYLGAI